MTLPAVGWISNRRSIPRASTGAPGSGKPPSMIVVAGARTGDRHRIGDVEVAGVREVLVECRDLDLVRTGRELDRVGARVRVGLGDRGSQRAAARVGGAKPVAHKPVVRVGRGVDDERPGGGRRSGRAEHQTEHRHRDEDEPEEASPF